MKCAIKYMLQTEVHVLFKSFLADISAVIGGSVIIHSFHIQI